MYAASTRFKKLDRRVLAFERCGKLKNDERTDGVIRLRAKITRVSRRTPYMTTYSRARGKRAGCTSDVKTYNISI